MTPGPKSEFEITRVFSAPFEEDVLVAYELEDGEVGMARSLVLTVSLCSRYRLSRLRDLTCQKAPSKVSTYIKLHSASLQGSIFGLARLSGSTKTCMTEHAACLARSHGRWWVQSKSSFTMSPQRGRAERECESTSRVDNYASSDSHGFWSSPSPEQACALLFRTARGCARVGVPDTFVDGDIAV